MIPDPIAASQSFQEMADENGLTDQVLNLDRWIGMATSRPDFTPTMAQMLEGEMSRVLRILGVSDAERKLARSVSDNKRKKWKRTTP